MSAPEHEDRPVRPGRPDRDRADRLVAGPGAAARRARRPRSSPAPAAPRRLAAVRRLDLADETTDDPAAAVEGADLVVIATPLSAYAEIGRRIAPALRAGAIVTDVGSVKGVVIRDLAPLLPAGRRFRPGPSGRRHRAFRAGSRVCRAVPRPLVHPDAAARDRARGGRQDHRAVGSGRHAGRDDGPPSITTRCWR